MIIIIPRWLIEIVVVAGGIYLMSLLGAGAYVIIAAVIGYYLLKFSWWTIQATITTDWRTFLRKHGWTLFWGIPCTVAGIALLGLGIPGVLGFEYLPRATILAVANLSLGVLVVTMVPFIVLLEKMAKETR